jgi:hypothetical protein
VLCVGWTAAAAVLAACIDTPDDDELHVEELTRAA